MQRFATDVLFLLNKENSNCSLGTSQVTSGLLLDTVRISAQVLKCSESASSTVWLQINPRGRWRKKNQTHRKQEWQMLSPNTSSVFRGFPRAHVVQWAFRAFLVPMRLVLHPYFLYVASERCKEALSKLPLENICSGSPTRGVHAY